VIEERSKFFMIAKGEWRATAKPMDERVVGFHLNALYSPFVEWRDLILEWLKARHNIERQKTFINTRLAQTWEIRGEKANQTAIEARREHYGDKLPAGVLMLTCGADVQKDRIEVSVAGWGLDSEVWLVEHRKLYGDPSLPIEHGDSPWRMLDTFLRKRYPHILGPTLHIVTTLVDSGNGNHTKRVYEFTGARESRGIHACKGVSGFGIPLISSANRKGVNKALLFGVGVDTGKDLIYSSLRVEQQGPGFVHFPLTEDFDSEYFRQLAAEEKVSEVANGKMVSAYVQKYERNEALDCLNYAAAARDVANPNFGAIKANLTRRAEEMNPAETATPEPARAPAQVARPLMPAKPLQSASNPFSNSFINSWRR
jgi:phage terminase large subunit GpA-like protein